MASKYLPKYPVPSGYPELLHDFAREVLRDQPENILEFGYFYFKAKEQVIHYQFINFKGVPFDFKKKEKHVKPPATRQPINSH